jgi:hypothetical protein
MEIFLGSFVIFLISAAALMLGQFFGRDPVSGSCSPGGHCSHAGACQLKCAFRSGHEPEGGAR